MHLSSVFGTIMICYRIDRNVRNHAHKMSTHSLVGQLAVIAQCPSALPTLQNLSDTNEQTRAQLCAQFTLEITRMAAVRYLRKTTTHVWGCARYLCTVLAARDTNRQFNICAMFTITRTSNYIPDIYDGFYVSAISNYLKVQYNITIFDSYFLSYIRTNECTFYLN